mgnify:CR=1 FL=1
MHKEKERRRYMKDRLGFYDDSDMKEVKDVHTLIGYMCKRTFGSCFKWILIGGIFIVAVS